MKISVFEVEGWEKDAFAELAGEHDVRFESAALDASLAPDHADADAISTFIYSTLDADVLDAFDHLELIATRSTGVDHIDTTWCGDNGVVIANVPAYGSNTVAEHVFALLLALSHHVVDAADRTRRGDFSQAGLQGFDLQGRTLGVVGTGDIGQHVIRIAKGLGMDVVAFDVQRDEQLADKLGFRYADLEQALADADVVTIHVPGNDKTHHLIGDDEFGAMKHGSVLINTSRGSVVETEALLRALDNGTVSAAGLDVVEEEPTVREEAELLHSVFADEHDLETLLTDHILLRMRNVLITPHNAFNTREAVQRILATTRHNIQAFTAGDADNVVG